MSLLDDLHKFGDILPPSHVVIPQDVGKILGALVVAVERGPESLKEVIDDPSKIDSVLVENAAAVEAGATEGEHFVSDPQNPSGVTPAASPLPGIASAAEVPSAPIATTTGQGSGDPQVTVDDKDAKIAALEQQVQTLLANQNKTQVG